MSKRSKKKDSQKIGTKTKVKTLGDNSPSIFIENGDVSIDYGESSLSGESSKQKQISKSKWKKYAAILTAIIAALAGVAEFSGYSLRDLFSDEKTIEQPNNKLSSPQEAKTSGDNSPAVITNDGNATFNYDETIQVRDSTL